jgi:hypothetical protein
MLFELSVVVEDVLAVVALEEDLLPHAMQRERQ